MLNFLIVDVELRLKFAILFLKILMSFTQLCIFYHQIISLAIFTVQHFGDILMEEPETGEFFSLINVEFMHLGNILLYCLEVCVEALLVLGIDLVLMEEGLLLGNEL